MGSYTIWEVRNGFIYPPTLRGVGGRERAAGPKIKSIYLRGKCYPCQKALRMRRSARSPIADHGVRTDLNSGVSLLVAHSRAGPLY